MGPGSLGPVYRPLHPQPRSRAASLSGTEYSLGGIAGHTVTERGLDAVTGDDEGRGRGLGSMNGECSAANGSPARGCKASRPVRPVLGTVIVIGAEIALVLLVLPDYEDSARNLGSCDSASRGPADLHPGSESVLPGGGVALD